ncbi:MAG: 16S rRNA (adenine(1518)-N(6)/adenine(1519)-N(6))-dimethyltransferase, partial [Clostridiales bacterium]|nr:16S rRNA (adenine(1518)-N(6)/adenine(1519)-N(6))-dimethyltransferase [Clostridiales bacterium]
MREIKPLLTRYGFHFSKSMGQNFLIDGGVPRAIAEASGADETTAVLEIGPGIGPLTVQLAQRAGKVAAVELDTALLPVLAETLADCSNVTVIPGNIMKLDLDALLEEHCGGLTPIVCANLPYNITTPVLTRLLESRRFASVTVMIQREVAKRICARPNTSDYGAFTLLCQ